MPIQCPVEIASLSSEEFGNLDYSVMGLIFESQNQIGRLADERIYQADIAERLAAANISVQREVPVSLVYETFVKTLYLDLLVCQRAIYELKTVAALTSAHVAQMLNYLYLLDLPRGKLVNLRSSIVDSQFINAPISKKERCGFAVSCDQYDGDPSVLALVVDLIRDWGTSLSIPLYREAITHLLGSGGSADQLLPLSRNGRILGNQKFYLIDEANAFEVTAFVNLNNDYAGQLNRLIKLSPLDAIHWINIGPHSVTFRTIHRT
jgi:GxxExxY protein